MNHETFTVTVTEEHLNKAIAGAQADCVITHICPVAQAVRERYPDACLGYTNFSVENGVFDCVKAQDITLKAHTHDLQENGPETQKIREILPITLTFKFMPYEERR